MPTVLHEGKKLPREASGQFPVSGDGDVGRQGQEDMNIRSRDENPEV